MIDFMQRYSTQKACLKYLANQRWGKRVICPHCECARIYYFKDQVRYKCTACKRLFNACTHTIFHNTKISLPKWFLACYLAVNNKKGISSPQLAEKIEVTQKTAWNMLMKIRSLFPTGEVLRGDVEIDETFVGGKQKNMHKKSKRRIKYQHGRDTRNKRPVVGMFERDGGRVVAVHTSDIRSNTMKQVIDTYVGPESVIFTDGFNVYDNLTEHLHLYCSHSHGMYVIGGSIHVQNMENFFSHLKRTILATHHWVSPEFLQLYLFGIMYRYNNRHMTATERFDNVFCDIKKGECYANESKYTS